MSIIVRVATIAALLMPVPPAQAQILPSGSLNGNGNTGVGNGNGNGNGNNNGNSVISNANTVRGSSVSVRNQRQAPAAIAPGLAAAGIETCLGSASLGASGPGFGLSFGQTVEDRGCTLRLFSRTLQSLGYRRAAVQMLCYDPKAADALGVEGVRCQVGPRAVAPDRTARGQHTCRNYNLLSGCKD